MVAPVWDTTATTCISVCERTPHRDHTRAFRIGISGAGPRSGKNGTRITLLGGDIIRAHPARSHAEPQLRRYPELAGATFSATVGTASFGSIQSTSVAPRIIQLAANIQF